MSVEFGERVKKELSKQNLSLKELASQIGINYVTLTRYISGEREPGESSIKDIAQKLGVTTDSLLFDESKKNDNSLVTNKSDGKSNVAVSFGIIAGLILLALGLGILSDKDKDNLSNMLKDDKNKT